MADPDARADDRAEPGHAPRLRPVVPARATARSWCRTRATAASCSRSPGTATRWSARPTRRSPTPMLEPRAARRRRSTSSSRRPAATCQRPPTRADVLSVFAASARWCRPATARTPRRCRATTRSTSTRSGLLTITGGKWTTYRNMAEDCVDQAATLAGLPPSGRASRRTLTIHGSRPARRAVRRARRLRLRRAGDPGAHARRPGAGRAAPPRAAVHAAPRSSGRRATRWRGRSRTCWRAAPARSS